MSFSSSELTKLIPLKTGETRLLGVDVGDKTLGLSLSDRLWQIAQPYRVIRRQGRKQDFLALAESIQKENVVALVLGLPLNMNGTEGPQAEKVRLFASQCEEMLGCPTLLWDERLSTLAVSRTLLAADTSRRKRAEVVDKMAAAFILQGVLDGLDRVRAL